MSQEQKPFAVKDRRHFTSDGRPRTEPNEEPADQAAKVPPPPAQPAAAPPPPAPEADFSSFLLSLGAQASHVLSSEAPSLEEARSIISILEMLKDKTEGRRTEREDRILEGILYELRMGYLARTRVGGA